MILATVDSASDTKLELHLLFTGGTIKYLFDSANSSRVLVGYKPTSFLSMIEIIILQTYMN